MAEGDIGAVIASLEFDNDYGYAPNIIHVSGNVYAIVYTDGVDDGWIKTVTISTAGAIAFVAGGSLEFDDVQGARPKIIHVSDDVYAIAYTGPVAAGWIKTVTISDAGAMALVAGGSLKFEAVYGYSPDIIHVSGNVYAIVYSDSVSDGWIKTVTISDAGAIAPVAGGSLEFDDVAGITSEIIHIKDDIYAIAYKGPDADGWLKTVTIDALGAIGFVAGGSLEFDDVDAADPDIIHIKDDVYAIAYQGNLVDGWIKTVTISDAGAMALVAGGSLEFDISNGQTPNIIHVSHAVYAIAYTGPDGDGWLKTVTISALGAIAFVAGGSLEFDDAAGIVPNITHIGGSIYAVAYQGPDGDGWIKTVTIETHAKIHHLQMMGIG